MHNNLSRNKKITLIGAFSALVVLLGATNLGIIPIGSIASITILHIPVILIVIFTGLSGGLFVGTIFGIVSLFRAFLFPTGIITPLFMNPFCSVLPRILIAVVAWITWNAINLSQKTPLSIRVAITSSITTISHTLLVIGAIYFFEGKQLRELLGGIGFFGLVSSLSLNIILETIAAVLVCVCVYSSVNGIWKNKPKLCS